MAQGMATHPQDRSLTRWPAQPGCRTCWRGLQRAFSLTPVFVSMTLVMAHDLCDAVVALRMGQVVESAPIEQLVHPQNPCTRALIAAMPAWAF